MRVNPNHLPDVLAALATVQKQQDNALLQLASGRRVNTPSDDPAASAQVIGNHDRSSQVDSFQRSLGSLSGQLQAADSTLGSIVTAITRAISLGVQGANSGTLSPSDRTAIADELRGVQSQLLSLANASFQGRYLFSGTEQVQPFVLDALAPSGVRYDGNLGVNQINVGNGYQLQMNLPGSQVFATPGADMFQAMSDLITAVLNNTGVDVALTSLRQAFDNITAQRVFYGNGLNQIQSQQNILNNQDVQLSAEESDLAGADMAEVASRVARTETARQATLAAVGRVSQATLFDFLR